MVMGVSASRMLPHSIDAEQAVLGSMLIDKSAIVRATERLSPEDFYRPAHQILFRVFTELADENNEVDIITATEELKKRKQLDAVGGVTYLSTLANYVPTAAQFERYADIVEENALLRRLVDVATSIAAKGYDGSEDAEAILDQAEQAIFDLGQRRIQRSYQALPEVIAAAFDHISYLDSVKGSLTGIPTGFPDLDKVTSGLQPSELIVIAARPSQGKSTLAMNLARHAALNDKKVAIFSLEMSVTQLAMRMICTEARLDGQRLRTGSLSEHEWQALTTSCGVLSKADIFIDDTPSISAMELRAKARRIKHEHGLDLIIVDYLQLMHLRERIENRQQEIAKISRSLKALARELNIPVIALSQLSRAVTQRTDKRPQLSDLRESGAIEQDADVVMFIHHEEKNEDRESEDQYQSRFPSETLVKLIIAKQRNGPTGEVPLYFFKNTGRFEAVTGRREAG